MQEDNLAAVVCLAQASLVGKALPQASLVEKGLAMVFLAMVSLAMASLAMASLAIKAFLERKVCLAQGCLEKEVS